MRVYENRRSQQVDIKYKKEREPSKEKPDINASSGSIVESKKLKIFENIFDTINPNPTTANFIDPATADYRKVSIQIMDLIMDVFTEFEL